MFTALATCLGLLSVLVPAIAFSPAGAIVQPTAGTTVAPGALFNFTYNVMADYSVSSFAYHVWLLDTPGVSAGGANASLTSLLTSTSGYYFGKFDYPNYPAVPYAQNPAPPQFTMPDFSKSPGGFASGEAAYNLALQLVVIEEWGNDVATIGHRLRVSSTEIVYNATH